MTIIPNLGNRILQANGVVPFGINHTALLHPANSSGDYRNQEAPTFYRRRIEVAGSYYAPPKEVVSSMLAKSWTLNLSLNFGAATITETNKVLEYAPGICETVADKCSSAFFQSINYTGSANSGEDNISCSMEIGALTGIQWDWTLEAWTLPIDISVVASGEESGGAFGLGRSTGEYKAAISSVPISLFGKTYSMFENASPESDAFPTGSISLVPTAYLPLVAPV